MQRSVAYTLKFATGIAVVCAIIVSSFAVGLKDRQDANKLLDKKRNVLEAAGLREPNEKVDPAEVDRRFARIDQKIIELATGEDAPEIDVATFDQRRYAADPGTSSVAPANRAGVKRVPLHAEVYELRDENGALEMVILPIEGYGLWSTLYGFIALDADLQTIRGLTFYEHAETPGLGGEVDNPSWKAKWKGRLAFGDDGAPKIRVIKGAAGPATEAPFEVDGLSGATITSRGVTNLLTFWLSEEIFGPYLERLGRETGRRAA